jgi:hypothetical protein
VRVNLSCFFGILFGWSGENFSTEKKQKGKNSWNEKKTKKQNLKLGEETPGPGRMFFATY